MPLELIAKVKRLGFACGLARMSSRIVWATVQLEDRPVREKLLLKAQTKGPTTWRCLPCQRTFKSKAALATHFFQKHGRKAAFRFYSFYSDGHVCRACVID